MKKLDKEAIRYYVYCVVRSNDLDALNDVYEQVEGIKAIGTPDWDEGIGYAEEMATTAESRAEFEEDYHGVSSNGYAHAIKFEGTLSEDDKENVLNLLEVDRWLLERNTDRHKISDYTKVHGNVEVDLIVQDIA